MSREKINFDKKKLCKLIQHCTLTEKGVLLDICRFMFTDEHYHLLIFDESTNTYFTIETLQLYLIQENGISELEAQAITTGLLKKNVIDANEDGHVYCPLLYHQKQSSINKRRHTNFKKGQKTIAPVITEPNTQGAKAISATPSPMGVEPVVGALNSETPPPATETTLVDTLAQADVKNGLLFEIEEVKQETGTQKSDAEEVLTYLSEKSEKPRGFKINVHNLKFIQARLKDKDVTVNDLKLVIDFKCMQWKDREQATYLRPQTLFTPKNFETYLNEALVYYQQRKIEATDWLAVYIKKYHAEVSKMKIQLSEEECQKINKKCSNREVIKTCLMNMENNPGLLKWNSSVYLTLLKELERAVKSGKIPAGPYISKAQG